MRLGRLFALTKLPYLSEKKTTERNDMIAFFETMKTRARQAQQYRTTVSELKRLSIHDALDLDIYHGDIPEIARKAVYGS